MGDLDSRRGGSCPHRWRFAHWSLRYARDRARLLLFTLVHPNAPWLTPDAVRFLAGWLRPTHRGIEWGSGRSTRWFGQRVERLISIEHDPGWYEKVNRMLLEQPRNNVQLLLLPRESAEYYTIARDLPNECLDFALVDGVSDLRDVCANEILPKIKPGGLLIVDDVHRYLPSTSRSPRALPAGAAPFSHTWEDVGRTVADWPLNLTTSGVTDTAIWTKPFERSE